MSNAKIISIIDHENHAIRSDVQTSINAAVDVAFARLELKLEQLQLRIKYLEDRVKVSA